MKDGRSRCLGVLEAGRRIRSGTPKESLIPVPDQITPPLEASGSLATGADRTYHYRERGYLPLGRFKQLSGSISQVLA
jgi:hypothetical protein